MNSLNTGDRLKRLRKLHKYTTKYIADKLGFTQSYISKIENNKAIPDIDLLANILEIYNVPLTIFFSDDKNNYVTPELLNLLSAAKELSQDEIIKLTTFINAKTK